ncbi:MAG: hypothetical protein N2442_13140 [Spirochaetes bacterium]|nr:hypothetical protein [Spirochaetota bacterium]
MNPFMNPVLLRILLLILHLVPPSKEGVQVVLVQETKVLGTYTISFKYPGQYTYQFKGKWEEGKNFTVERSFLYSYLYTAYPDPKGEPVALNLIKELESLVQPKEDSSSVVGDKEGAITLTKISSLLLIGSDSLKILCILPATVSK